MGRQRQRPIRLYHGVAPRCTTQGTFDEWWKEARKIREDAEVTFCTDCTPEFQAENIATGRCENAYIKFYRDPVGELYGALKPTWPSLDVEVHASNEKWLPKMLSNSIAYDLGLKSE